MHLRRIIPGSVERSTGWLAAALGLLLPVGAHAGDLPMVPGWQRFEHQFRSEVAYTNPMAVLLRVEFRSPQGERQTVPGFWDGGKVWRARVLPGVAGRWSFRTICSDTNNSGLHNRTGEFLCTAGERGNRFLEHGTIRVAREGTFFEHADRTPLFLVTELDWNSVRRDSAKELEVRTRELARRKVNALAWTLWPGKDERGEGALIGDGSGGLNLDFMQRLDAKVEAITRAGLVNIIAPSWELRNVSDEVPETQTAALMQQAIARWHANPVLWLVAVESGSSGANIGRWQRIAQQVFAEGAQGPVIFLPGETHWLWEEFRNEKWVAGLGLKTAHLVTDDALQWFHTGPLAVEYQQSPARPVLDLMPMPVTSSAATVTARQLLWWGLLMNPPAGVSLQSESGAAGGSSGSAALLAADFMGSIDFRKLKPAPRLLAVQPGFESPRRFVGVAASENRDLIVAYVPAGPTVQLVTASIPSRHWDNWFSPRTGERVLAAGVVSGTSVTYRTPGEGDWVLLVRGEK